MGRKDTYTNPYIAKRKRFAELVNVNIYRGEKIVEGEMLTRLEGSYPALGSIGGNKKRDILMEQKSPRIRYGIELET